MSSRLQLDMRNLSLGRRNLVNAYEVEAGIGVIAGNTVWSMPERLECEVLQKARYIYIAVGKCIYIYTYLPFTFYYNWSLVIEFLYCSTVWKPVSLSLIVSLWKCLILITWIRLCRLSSKGIPSRVGLIEHSAWDDEMLMELHVSQRVFG